jgi:hypothetical protein
VVFPVPALKLQDITSHWDTTASFNTPSYSVIIKSRKSILRLVHRCTGRSLTDSEDTRCCINKIWPPEDEQGTARNMYVNRIVINVLKCVSSWSLAKAKMCGQRRFRSVIKIRQILYFYGLGYLILLSTKPFLYYLCSRKTQVCLVFLIINLINLKNSCSL